MSVHTNLTFLIDLNFLAFCNRANDADDIMLSGSEIKGIALAIEEELFRYIGEVGTSYRSKFRTIAYHIRDQRNKVLSLFVFNF